MPTRHLLWQTFYWQYAMLCLLLGGQARDQIKLKKTTFTDHTEFCELFYVGFVVILLKIKIQDRTANSQYFLHTIRLRKTKLKLMLLNTYNL